jgi:hypothetical protein
MSIAPSAARHDEQIVFEHAEPARPDLLADTADGGSPVLPPPQTPMREGSRDGQGRRLASSGSLIGLTQGLQQIGELIGLTQDCLDTPRLGFA